VTNRPDVHMRLVALEFLLRHFALCSSDQNSLKLGQNPRFTSRPDAS
jgi:hypothetical protein